MSATKLFPRIYGNKGLSLSLSFSILSLILCLFSCKKLVEIGPPQNQLTVADAFLDSASVTSVVAGMYSFMYNYNNSNSSPYKDYITTLSSLTADETYYFSANTYPQFENNAIPPADTRNLSLWADSYTVIYMANNILGNIGQLKSGSAAFSNQVTGEAKFMRAFCLFYLTNLFGDVPLITTTDVTKTALLPRNPQADVYQQILTDLQSAQTLLAEEYSYSGGERTRVNKYAATAMLARVYLYMGMYSEADSAATRVIDQTSLFNIEPDLNRVFLKNSSEAIFQFNTNVYGATYVGRDFLPYPGSNIPNFVLRDNLLAAFEPSDMRRTDWTKFITYGGINYYYPYKYKQYQSFGSSTDSVEYDMVLRLSEQYLIRAEARAQLNQLADAAADLDLIRARAGLPQVTVTSQQAMLSLIGHERQVELFCEWGHRWLDLKRTNTASNVLSPLIPTWVNTAVLFPVPQQAISSNKNLTQNPGYN